MIRRFKLLSILILFELFLAFPVAAQVIYPKCGFSNPVVFSGTSRNRTFPFGSLFDGKDFFQYHSYYFLLDDTHGNGFDYDRHFGILRNVKFDLDNDGVYEHETSLNYDQGFSYNFTMLGENTIRVLASSFCVEEDGTRKTQESEVQYTIDVIPSYDLNSLTVRPTNGHTSTSPFNEDGDVEILTLSRYEYNVAIKIDDLDVGGFTRSHREEFLMSIDSFIENIQYDFDNDGVVDASASASGNSFYAFEEKGDFVPDVMILFKDGSDLDFSGDKLVVKDIGDYILKDKKEVLEKVVLDPKKQKVITVIITLADNHPLLGEKVRLRSIPSLSSIKINKKKVRVKKRMKFKIKLPTSSELDQIISIGSSFGIIEQLFANVIYLELDPVNFRLHHNVSIPIKFTNTPD